MASHSFYLRIKPRLLLASHLQPQLDPLACNFGTEVPINTLKVLLAIHGKPMEHQREINPILSKLTTGPGRHRGEVADDRLDALLDAAFLMPLKELHREQ
jgi:hypothetical protein